MRPRAIKPEYDDFEEWCQHNMPPIFWAQYRVMKMYEDNHWAVKQSMDKLWTDDDIEAAKQRVRELRGK